MIRYIKYQNQNPESKAYGKWYLRSVFEETVDIDKLADHMSAHNSPYSRGIIRGILTDAVTCIKELMLDGKAVKLQDLALFRIGLISNGADSIEEAKATLITGVRFNAKGTGEMSVSQLKGEIHLKELKHYAGGDMEDEDDEDPGNDPSNGGGGNSQQGGGQQQTTPKYTLTLKKANNDVISTTELEAGATITYPTATSGYMWPADAPTVMPAQATTVTEVVDDDPNVL